jgi:hypothetical protein
MRGGEPINSGVRGGEPGVPGSAGSGIPACHCGSRTRPGDAMAPAM